MALNINNKDRLNIEREACKRSLSTFIKRAWHILEPVDEYVHNWHIDAVCEHLEAISNGQLNRLIINEPPGCMKSLCVSVAWLAWEWGPRGDSHIRSIGTSYKENLALRDSIKTRRLIKSDWYQYRWPIQLRKDQDSTHKFENEDTGFRAAMPFGSLMGERAHRVAVDDPLSVSGAKSEAELNTAQETFCEALPTRLVSPKESAIILIMQRLHERDPSGIALAKNMGYEHLMLPMEFESSRRCYSIVKPRHFDAGDPVKAKYDGEKQTWYKEDEMDQVPDNRKEILESKPWKSVYNQDVRKTEDELLFPARFPKEVVDRDKKAMGVYASEGQMAQRPAPRSGGMFEKGWFSIVDKAPHDCEFVRGWDLAATIAEPGKDPAYTAGVKIGRSASTGIFYIADVKRGQWSPHGVMSNIKNTATQDGYPVKIDLPQDPGQSGKFQVRFMVSQLAGFTVHFSPETGSKEDRAEPLACQAEAGNVMLVRGPWNDDFLDEISLFPRGAKKDQVDGASRAFARLTQSTRINDHFAGPVLLHSEG